MRRAQRNGLLFRIESEGKNLAFRGHFCWEHWCYRCTQFDVDRVICRVVVGKCRANSDLPLALFKEDYLVHLWVKHCFLHRSLVHNSVQVGSRNVEVWQVRCLLDAVKIAPLVKD
jgi:hypothetical protein